MLQFNFSTGNIFLTVKNENFLKRLTDFKSHIHKLENADHSNKENQDTRNSEKNNNLPNNNFALYKSNLSSGKRNNLHLNSNSECNTNKSFFQTFKSNEEAKKPLKVGINSNAFQTNSNHNNLLINNSSNTLNNPQRIIRHNKTKSCGTYDAYEDVITIHNAPNSIFNNSDTKNEVSHDVHCNASNLAKYKKLSLARDKKKEFMNLHSVRERSIRLSSRNNSHPHDLRPENQLNNTFNYPQKLLEGINLGQKNKMCQFSDYFPPQNEENLSLQQMIGTMLSTKKRNKATDSFLEEKSDQKVSESFIDENEGQNLNISYNYSKHELNNSNLREQQNYMRSAKRKKQINKIIKLSLPSNIVTNSQSKEVLKLPSKEAYFQDNSTFKPTKLNFDQKLTKGDKDKEVKLNFNLSQEDLSFEEKEKSKNSAFKEEKETPHDNKEEIKELLLKLENFEEYYFDSTILYNLIKSFYLKKESLGYLYLQTNNEDLKSQLICEMICQLSKIFLRDSIVKSLSVVLKEKKLNKNFFIAPQHQHSIEFCIVDIFNTFLGANNESEDFYTKILPNFLSEKYKLPFISKLKEHVSLPNIFVLMQNCNRVFFEDNLNVNFNSPYPFVVQDIKYISPYNVNKWYMLAVQEEEDKIKIHSSKNQSNNNTTNMKRMKYSAFELKDTLDTSLKYFKKAEKEKEDYRVSLIRSIYYHVYNKRNELALKLCDYYLQKFADTLFLNPIIYLILAEVYSETHGASLARMFFEKALNLVLWQFPGDANPILIDMYYTFSLILFKQNIENPDEDNLAEIEEHLTKSHNLCKKFFPEEHEKKLKITLQICLVKLTRDIKSYSESLFEDILKSIIILQNKRMLKEAVIYLNLFVDLLNPIVNVQEEKKIVLIQK